MAWLVFGSLALVAANEASIFEFFALRRDWLQAELHDGPELISGGGRDEAKSAAR